MYVFSPLNAARVLAGKCELEKLIQQKHEQHTQDNKARWYHSKHSFFFFVQFSIQVLILINTLLYIECKFILKQVDIRTRFNEPAS